MDGVGCFCHSNVPISRCAMRRRRQDNFQHFLLSSRGCSASLSLVDVKWTKHWIQYKYPNRFWESRRSLNLLIASLFQFISYIFRCSRLYVFRAYFLSQLASLPVDEEVHTLTESTKRIRKLKLLRWVEIDSVETLSQLMISWILCIKTKENLKMFIIEFVILSRRQPSEIGA